MSKNGVISCVHFCLRSLGLLERCAIGSFHDVSSKRTFCTLWNEILFYYIANCTFRISLEKKNKNWLPRCAIWTECHLEDRAKRLNSFWIDINWENVHKLHNPWCTLLNSLASPLQHISLQAEWAALGLQWLGGASLIHSATPLPQVKHSTHNYIHTTLFRRAEKGGIKCDVTKLSLQPNSDVLWNFFRKHRDTPCRRKE